MALGTSFGRVCVFGLLGVALAIPAIAQEPEEPAADSGWTFRFGLEARANYRDSEENRFQVPFPFEPPMLPVGQTHGFEETVNAGSHFEVSNVALFGDRRLARPVHRPRQARPHRPLRPQPDVDRRRRSTSTRRGSASAASPSRPPWRRVAGSISSSARSPSSSGRTTATCRATAWSRPPSTASRRPAPSWASTSAGTST